MSTTPPASEIAEWPEGYLDSVEASKEQVGRLADWIMDNLPDDIFDGGAVDVAISIMTRVLEEQGKPMGYDNVDMAYNDLKRLRARMNAESFKHHEHGDIGCGFFGRRTDEIDNVIYKWDQEIPKTPG